MTELDSLREHAIDCDKRLYSLEGALERADDDIQSLRSSRHEHANWLNRHNLELSQVTQTVKDTLHARLCDAEKEMERVNEMISEQQKAIASLASDAKVAAWKVGLILGVVVFMAERAAAFLHF